MPWNTAEDESGQWWHPWFYVLGSSTAFSASFKSLRPPKSCRSSPFRLLFRNSGNHCKQLPSTANNRQRSRSGPLLHFTTALNAIGMIRIARMFTTLIIGFTAGPAVSL